MEAVAEKGSGCMTPEIIYYLTFVSVLVVGGTALFIWDRRNSL